MDLEQIIFFVAIFGVVGMLTWWVSRLFAARPDDKVRQRLRDTGSRDATGAPVPEVADPGLGQMLHRIGQAAAKPFEPTTREKQSEMRKRLARAGIYSAATARLVSGCKVIFLIGGLIGGYSLGLMLDNVMLGLSFGGLIGYLLPSLWLKFRISGQQQALSRALPDAVDLMVVCVEAGLTVDSAMQRVGQELATAHPALARELDITHMETRVGLARADALKNFGIRTGNAAIQSLSSMLIQAERFGTSIASALRIHAESLRQTQQHAAEESAAKATVKLTFPVVLFIFPAVLIVIAGPAAIGLFKSALFAD